MDQHKTHKKTFLRVLAVNLVIFILELAVALYSGSLMMLSDSFHLFIHVIGSAVAYASEFEFLGLAGEEIKKYTSLTNVVLFFVTVVIITVGAIGRLSNPPELKIGWSYFTVAFLGLAGNIYGANVLHRIDDHECALNINPLYWCMVVDALSSVIVIMGALAIKHTGILVLDPALSFVLVALMIWRGWKMLNTTLGRKS